MSFVVPFVVLVLWFVLVLFVSYGSMNLWVRTIGAVPLRVMVAPGVIVHEYSHALGCLLTGAKIKEIVLFEKTGGHVTHQMPRVPLIGGPVISFAPVIGCLLFLALCGWLLGDPLKVLNLDSKVPVASAGGAGAEQVAESSIEFAKIIGQRVQTNFEIFYTEIPNQIASWKMWLFLYLSVCFTICMAPSRQDFKNSYVAVIVLVLLLALAYAAMKYMNVSAESASMYVLTHIFGTLCFSVTMLFVVLALSLAPFGVKKILGK
ncbi:MAG: M50 family metallopeptidase [Planctomycetes bacterium]|nr:M50 family metallopeptidase [Planctomycetota bacterium]